ncbi:MAG TPA: hypothetical protein GXX18_05080 [Bacillales bacterium]|nr:hypothetical protein [Bacillales bacterium]
MFTVHFIENKNILLSQLLQNVPSVGQDLKIKGRKAKVLSVNVINERTIHVNVVREEIKKKQQPVLDNKKKKR